MSDLKNRGHAIYGTEFFNCDWLRIEFDKIKDHHKIMHIIFETPDIWDIYVDNGFLNIGGKVETLDLIISNISEALNDTTIKIFRTFMDDLWVKEYVYSISDGNQKLEAINLNYCIRTIPGENLNSSIAANPSIFEQIRNEFSNTDSIKIFDDGSYEVCMKDIEYKKIRIDHLDVELKKIGGEIIITGLINNRKC